MSVLYKGYTQVTFLNPAEDGQWEDPELQEREQAQRGQVTGRKKPSQASSPDPAAPKRLLSPRKRAAC